MSEAAVAEELAPVIPIIDPSRIKLTELTAEQAIEGWELLVPYLEKVFARSAGRIGMKGAYEAVKSGMAGVLLVWDPEIHRIFAVMVAEGKIFPDRRVYSIGLCGGDNLHVWAERIWPALQLVAKQQGFNQIEVVGRRGWKRFIPGAKEIATFYAMDLDGEPIEEEEMT